MGLRDRRMETTDHEIPIGAGHLERQAVKRREKQLNGQGSACLKSDLTAKKTFQDHKPRERKKLEYAGREWV